MSFKHKAGLAATTAALLGVAGSAQAEFQGRDATGAASSTCTSTGTGKCTYFYDTTLDITILNNWNIGSGTWSASAAPGSAQALAATAGFNASGLTGWLLPTGDGRAPAGALNQSKSIWTSVGSSFAGMVGQFDGVQVFWYWSGSEFAPAPGIVWGFFAESGRPEIFTPSLPWIAVAVRPGDVAAVPEPQTYTLMLMGVSAVMLALRRRPC